MKSTGLSLSSAATCPPVQIARANRLAALQPVKLDPQVFRLLEDCIQWHQQTRGAFDITAGPLLKCWGFTDGQYCEPSRDTIESTLEHVGIHHIQLEPGSHTISFDTEGVTLDLGAVGKGYAMERAKEILADYEIESAILHGGASTICAVGTPPEDVAWHGHRAPGKRSRIPFCRPFSYRTTFQCLGFAHQRRSYRREPLYLRFGENPFNQEIEHSAILSILEMATLFPISGSLPSCMKTLFPVTYSPLPCW